MKTTKLIVQPCHGVFRATPEFKAVIESKGYKSLWSIEARTDKDLIAFVERNARENGTMLGIDDWTKVRVVEVDTSRPWFIDNYDGSEYIKYVEYEFINKELNLVRMKD